MYYTNFKLKTKVATYIIAPREILVTYNRTIDNGVDSISRMYDSYSHGFTDLSNYIITDLGSTKCFSGTRTGNNENPELIELCEGYNAITKATRSDAISRIVYSLPCKSILVTISLYGTAYELPILIITFLSASTSSFKKSTC